jgi:dTDP-4-amino-4,6-dideoxygalactose transaminase
VPSRNPGERHIFNQYVIRAQRRDELRAHLERCGVGTEVYYPLPLHEQQCFAYLGHSPEDFPEAHRAAEEVLALPIYPELTAEQREHVARSIADFYRA